MKLQDANAVADVWEKVAPWWQESFTDGVDPEYTDQILPLVQQYLPFDRFGNQDSLRVLDIGTGEGQVARFVANNTHAAVTGIDPSGAQLQVAIERGGEPRYIRSEADTLPFADGAFQVVIACLVFEHIEKIDVAISEVGRVLASGGRFLLFLNHPLLQAPGSGWIDDHILNEQYWRIGPYLDEGMTVEEVAKGVRIPFAHRPLSRYINALAASGLVVTQMEEPAPPEAFLEKAPEYRATASIPRLLFLQAEKLLSMNVGVPK